MKLFPWLQNPMRCKLGGRDSDRRGLVSKDALSPDLQTRVSPVRQHKPEKAMTTS